MNVSIQLKVALNPLEKKSRFSNDFQGTFLLEKMGNAKFLKFVSLLYNNYIIPGYFSGDTEIVENPREKKTILGLLWSARKHSKSYEGFFSHRKSKIYV